jgi:hypothetical protein
MGEIYTGERPEDVTFLSFQNGAFAETQEVASRFVRTGPALRCLP